MSEKKLLSFNDVVEQYSFRPWGLRWRIRNRTVPFVKLGKSIYFDPNDLDAWIQENKISEIKLEVNHEKQKKT